MSEPDHWQVTARDWLMITGRGLVVAVDVPETNGVRRGDTIRFDLAPTSPGKPELIDADTTYTVSMIEESRCLVAHANGEQCVMGRALAVRPAAVVSVPQNPEEK